MVAAAVRAHAVLVAQAPHTLPVVVVDDHPAIRRALGSVIEDAPGLALAGTAATAGEGLELIDGARPAVAVIDHHLPDENGLLLTLRLQGLRVPPAVVVYSAFAGASLSLRGAVAGAADVVDKAVDPADLCDAVLAAGRGERRLRVTPAALGGAGARLDAEDLPIVAMFAHGTPHDEVARTLRVTPEWLTARRWAIVTRLGRTRTEPLRPAAV
jgi:DNA-binding NarL/FixJ family response regulator